jgi:hypothetical protein
VLATGSASNLVIAALSTRFEFEAAEQRLAARDKGGHHVTRYDDRLRATSQESGMRISLQAT